MNQKELLKLADEHRLWLAGEGGMRAVCRNQDLSGLDFSSLDFSGSDFSGSVFTGSKMDGTKWDEAVLCGANLSHLASVVKVSFVTAVLSGADLSGNSLVAPIFQQLYTERLDLSRCKIIDGTFERNTFYNCSFVGTSFTAMTVFSNTTLTRCGFNSSNFDGAILGDSEFDACTAAGCSMAGLNFFGVTFYDTDVRDCGLTDKQIARAEFHGACGYVSMCRLANEKPAA